MNESLRQDLQNCSDLLCQNDLDANNLANQIKELENIWDSISKLISSLNHLQELNNEVIQLTKNDGRLAVIMQMTQRHLEASRYEIKKIEGIDFYNSERLLNKILGRNHEAFMLIERLKRES